MTTASDRPVPVTPQGHTPGPWIHYPGSNSIHGTVQKGASAVCILCGPRSWRGESRRDHERSANARLIASAPDLLAALKALRQMAHAGIYDAMTESAEECAAIFAKADAAIAKAEATAHA